MLILLFLFISIYHNTFIESTTMNKDILEIEHSKFTKEQFYIDKMRYNLYLTEGGILEFVIGFESSDALQRDQELALAVDAKPDFEATALLETNKTALTSGDMIEQQEGYDYNREEVLSNFYYFGHESIENLTIEILEARPGYIVVNLSGETIVDGSNGNDPDAKLTLKEVRFNLDKNFQRGVM